MVSNSTVRADSAQHQSAGLFSLSLRLVVGWTYFSAFWRRLVLENKLDPDAAGYIGEKFNHFLPNALGIKPAIEHLVTHPDQLWWAMTVFTIVEGLVGLLFMLGLFTRLMSMAVFSLALGILLSAGWIGTTCLDEWQIGILGLAAGFTVFLSGGGRYSLDARLFLKRDEQHLPRNTVWLTSGILALQPRLLKSFVLSGSLIILFITLFTNQYFHGGVWGTLHNKSVKPKVEISDPVIIDDSLRFTVYRVEGADVYGSFLIGVALINDQDSTVFQLDGNSLAKQDPSSIRNKYVAKVKPGKHSLIIPLGSKAELNFIEPSFKELAAGNYQITLTDISGITWTEKLKVEKK